MKTEPVQTIEIRYIPEDKGYIAVAMDQAWCKSFGETPQEALLQLLIARYYHENRGY